MRLTTVTSSHRGRSAQQG